MECPEWPQEVHRHWTFPFQPSVLCLSRGLALFGFTRRRSRRHPVQKPYISTLSCDIIRFHVDFAPQTDRPKAVRTEGWGVVGARIRSINYNPILCATQQCGRKHWDKSQGRLCWNSSNLRTDINHNIMEGQWGWMWWMATEYNFIVIHGVPGVLRFNMYVIL